MLSLPLSQTTDSKERTFVLISVGEAMGSHILRPLLRRQEEEGTPVFYLSHVAMVRLLVSNTGISKVAAKARRIRIQQIPAPFRWRVWCRRRRIFGDRFLQSL
jgi:hypothetical protein